MTYKNHKSSFTLLETLVALYVLMMGLVGAMVLANNSIAVVSVFKNQIVASNLAQEGIEIVRNVRDSNYLAAKPGCTSPCDPNTADWTGMNQCFNPNGCRVHWNAIGDLTTANVNFLPCGGGATCNAISLHNTERMYGYGGGAGWQVTSFDRFIRMDYADASNRDVRVRSIVIWSDRLGGQRSVVVETYLTPHLN